MMSKRKNKKILVADVRKNLDSMLSWLCSMDSRFGAAKVQARMSQWQIQTFSGFVFRGTGTLRN